MSASHCSRFTLHRCKAALLAVLGVISVLLSACGPEGEVLFLRRAGAEMPVWIRGNTDSGVYVLYVHGGPAGSSLNQTKYPFFRALEEDYAVVYWDQRASGSAQGDVDLSKLTLEDYVLDLDGVIDLLYAHADVEQLFLFGHSWGGTVSPAYLADAARQAKVDGYIDVDGSHNIPLGLELSRDWTMERAAEELAAGNEPELWQKTLDFYDDNLSIGDMAVFQEHIGYVYRAGGYTFTPHDGVSIPEVLYSPVDLPSQWTRQEAKVAEAVGLLDIDLSEAMGNITLPTLILWGRHDGTLPVALAQDAFDALGTPEADKQIVVFEQSAHFPHREETPKALDVVTSFLEAYRN